MRREIMARHGPQPLGAESFAPSKHIKEELAVRGWSIEHLAVKAGLDVSVIRGVVEDEYMYQQSIADGLGRAFGTSAALWTNLQLAHLAFTLHEMWAERQRSGPAPGPAGARPGRS